MNDSDLADYVAQRRPALLRAACAIAGDRHGGEDLLQASLIRVAPRWAALGPLDDPRSIARADAYLRRTMRNLHISWRRERWRRDEVPMAELPDRPAAPQLTASPAGRAGAELWPLVLRLPPRQRAAVALRYYEQLSEAETAAALGVSVGTVKSSTSRGLATLRGYLTTAA